MNMLYLQEIPLHIGIQGDEDEDIYQRKGQQFNKALNIKQITLKYTVY